MDEVDAVPVLLGEREIDADTDCEGVKEAEGVCEKLPDDACDDEPVPERVAAWLSVPDIDCEDVGDKLGVADRLELCDCD